jgi:hypothetical protein
MNVTKDQMIARIASLNFLKIPAIISDTAKSVVFLASDRAHDDRNGRKLNGRRCSRLSRQSIADQRHSPAGGRDFDFASGAYEPVETAQESYASPPWLIMRTA